MAKQMKHSFDDINSALSYCPETGNLYWKVSPRIRAIPGDQAGCEKHVGHGRCYVSVGYQGREYLAHRIAWLLMTGAWPERHIDHKDGDGTNNAWTNLRIASVSQNLGNTGLHRHNTVGFKGVSYHKSSGKFTAQISINNRKKHLGVFLTAEEAHAAYRRAAAEYFGDFARFN